MSSRKAVVEQERAQKLRTISPREYELMQENKDLLKELAQKEARIASLRGLFGSISDAVYDAVNLVTKIDDRYHIGGVPRKLLVTQKVLETVMEDAPRHSNEAKSTEAVDGCDEDYDMLEYLPPVHTDPDFHNGFQAGLHEGLKLAIEWVRDISPDLSSASGTFDILEAVANDIEPLEPLGD